MRPLSHPAVKDITVEGILHALSDPVRVDIFARIAASSATHTCSNFLNVSEKPIPKSTLSQHFKILRDAGLIRSQRQGVELQSVSRCAEIDTRFPGLVGAIIAAHAVQSRARRPARKRTSLA
jgi:DNA-binding transcriptional ArsR family regulator